MKHITLTRGLVALVDDDVFDELNQFKWHAELGDSSHRTSYAVRRNTLGCGPKRLRMHRVIMNADESTDVDHIDHDGLNNLRSNLRFCNDQQNQFNARMPIRNTSGFKGVTFHRQIGKWQAALHHDGKYIYLGVFPTREEAARAYDTAAIAHFGDFAFLNFPRSEHGVMAEASS